MGQIYSYTKSAVNRVAAFGAAASQGVLIAAALIIFYDVVMRYVFNHPSTWVLEISEYMLVLLTFFGAANVQRHKLHIRMDFFFNKFSSKSRLYLVFFFNILTALFAILIFIASIQMTITAFKYGFKSSSLLGTSLYIPYAIVPVGIFLLLLQCIVDIVDSFNELKKRRLFVDKCL